MRFPIIAIAAITISGLAFNGVKTFTENERQENNKFQEVATSVVSETVAETDVYRIAIDENNDEEITEETVAKEPYVSPIDWETLKSRNEDVFAWVKIQGTDVNYPIMYGGEYIKKDIDGKNSYSGSIFVEEGTPNVIYGHHLKNGKMFSIIDEYNNEAFFNGHPDICLYFQEKELHLRPVIAVNGSADASVRTLNDMDSLSRFLEDKNINAGKLPAEVNNLYVFVTCNYGGNDFRTYLICSEVN